MGTELVVILGGIGVVALLILVLRFGKQLARFVLVLGGIVALIVGLLAFLAQGAANFQAATATKRAVEAVKVVSVGQTISTVIIALMSIALLAVLAVAGYVYLRWRLAEKRAQLPQKSGLWTPGPNALWGRQERLQLPVPQQPIVYIIESQPANAGIMSNLDGWGWEEGQCTDDKWLLE